MADVPPALPPLAEEGCPAAVAGSATASTSSPSSSSKSPSASISSFSSSRSSGESGGGRVPLSNNNSLPKEVSMEELELLKKLEEQNRSVSFGLLCDYC